MPIVQTIHAIFHQHSRQVLATLIRLLGDFDLAEEALQDAFAAALAQWPEQGVPANPSAWLVSTGRFKAIDQIRRRARFKSLDDNFNQTLETIEHSHTPDETWLDESHLADDRLRLVFTCCHPSLSAEARIALTLREVCDLTTEQIASAFLSQPSTIAQRIVRAKQKIKKANIPYEVPAPHELPERLDSVLQVVYLVFNEGYSRSQPQPEAKDLTHEAIRLGSLITEILPEPEAMGLLALMLLQDSRRLARTDSVGDLILLEAQDRTLWDSGQIQRGLQLVTGALKRGPAGIYCLQAAIAAVHAESPDWASTDWPQILGLYNLLFRLNPSPVVALNRAVALSMCEGPAPALELLDALQAQSELAAYQPLAAARADILRRLERYSEARAEYRRALALTDQASEQRFLARRLEALPT
ncbi:MAG TPA: RNA polymerase sigma factor [Cellvibrionaceae bacterium]